MKAHFFTPSDLAYKIDFSATFRISCDSNRIQKGAAMRVPPFFVKSVLASTLNSCMSAATNIAPDAAPFHLAELLRQEKLFRPYRDIVNYFLTKFDSDRRNAKTVSAVLRCTQPASMFSMLYADDLYANSCKVADIYDETTVNHIFIERVDSSIFHSLRK